MIMANCCSHSSTSLELLTNISIFWNRTFFSSVWNYCLSLEHVIISYPTWLSHWYWHWPIYMATIINIYKVTNKHISFPKPNLCFSGCVHYNDVMMSATVSQITSLKIVFSTVYSAADQRNIKAPRHWPLWGEFTGDRWKKRASDAENVSFWWCHHIQIITKLTSFSMIWYRLISPISSRIISLALDNHSIGAINNTPNLWW